MFRIKLYFIILWGIFLLATSSCDEVLETNELNVMVEKLNAKCPQMIDSETKLESVELKSDSILRYKYSLVNLYLQQVDTHQFYLNLWPGILSIVRTDNGLAKLRERKILFEYYYQDKNKQLIYNFKIRPTDYNQN